MLFCLVFEGLAGCLATFGCFCFAFQSFMLCSRAHVCVTWYATIAVCVGIIYLCICRCLVC